ncbi:MAG: hypothetical protein ACI9DM_001582, partial [Cyclobacteriaceae bacterium]
MRKFLLTYCLYALGFIAMLPSWAQKGPGGVGDTDGASKVVLWLDARSISQADNTTIATWSDLSGYANNATSIGLPTLQTGEFNGSPVVRFDVGTEQYFTIGDDASLISSNTTIYVVFKLNAVSQTDAALIYKTSDFTNGYALFENGNTGDLRASVDTWN